jgi:GNAT superfamily N-acetyltransferase
MPLELHLIQDQDLEEVVRLQHAAFSNPHGIHLFINPTSTQLDESVATTIVRRRDMMRNNKATSFTAVIDTDLKMIISCAIWEIYPHERTQEQVDTLARPPSPGPGSHPEAWNDFFGNLETQRRRLGTRPIAILRTLATHPEHQRRGAAALLLAQFTKAVDDEDLKAYIEASEIGKSLYARFGFTPVFERVFELEKYGGSGRDVNTVMLRPSRSKSLSTQSPPQLLDF